jgi:hypothetical protein
MKTLSILFIVFLIYTNSSAQSKTGISGNFVCKHEYMYDETSGRSTIVKGNEVSKISLNETSGILTQKGQKELVSFIKMNAGPASKANFYKFNTSTVYDLLQINIDNVPSGKGKSMMMIHMKPIGQLKLKLIGGCDY